MLMRFDRASAGDSGSELSRELGEPLLLDDRGYNSETSRLAIFSAPIESAGDSDLRLPSLELEKGVSTRSINLNSPSSKPQHMALFALLLCLYRITFPFLITTVLYARDPAKRK